MAEMRLAIPWPMTQQTPLSPHSGKIKKSITTFNWVDVQQALVRLSNDSLRIQPPLIPSRYYARSSGSEREAALFPGYTSERLHINMIII